jgi:ankyrin repeat protein
MELVVATGPGSDLPVPQRWVHPEIFHVEPGHWKKQLAGKHREPAKRGDVVALTALLREHPEFLNKRGSHGRTLLWEAARAGKLAAVIMLVEAGAHVNATGSYNHESLVQITPYCAARYYRRPAVAEYLASRGSTIDVFRAAFLGDLSRVEQELAARPELLNAEDPHDDLYYTPLLSFAVAGGHTNLAGALIQRGAEVARYSSQLIHLATRSGRPDLIELLFASGADPRVVGAGTFVEASDLDLLRYLFSRGVSPNGHDHDRTPALAYVARGDKGERPDRIALLLDHGAEVNAAGPNGKTALHYAATAGHVRVVRLLLERGANPTLADDDGNTPLDLARAAGKAACVELLTKRDGAR